MNVPSVFQCAGLPAAFLWGLVGSALSLCRWCCGPAFDTCAVQGEGALLPLCRATSGKNR